MTLDVPPDLQYSLLEFIAHINVEDYDAIPQDFINLGFTPEDVTPERLQRSGITEGLSFTFRQLAAGGGPKKIQERVKAEFQERFGSDLSDEELRLAAREEMMKRMEEQLASEGVDVKGVTNLMEEVSRRNRELFSLPPYVLYLARAFSTLEGIGLSIDENYSIIQECYPYLASRLFTDRNPRAKKALRAMLGLSEESLEAVDPNSALALVQQATLEAANGSSKRGGGLSLGKLVEMSEGFASYTSATGAVDRDGKGQAKAATEFGKLFLDPEGSTLQDIFVEETARYSDTLARAALRSLLLDSAAAKTASSVLKGPKQVLEQNEQVSNFFFPAPLKSLLVDRPAELPDLVESVLHMSEEDERIMETVTELREVLGPRLSDALARNSANALVSGGGEKNESTGRGNDSPPLPLADLLADEEIRAALVGQLPGAAALSRRLGARLLQRAAYRTEQTDVIPEAARKRLADVNVALAEAIEPVSSSAATTEQKPL